LEILPSRDNTVCENAQTSLKRITVQVNATTPLPRVDVSAQKFALTSRAGAVLLSALADRLMDIHASTWPAK